MPKLVGFSRFAALLEQQKVSRRILSGGPASMSSRTVTQMSKSCGCSKARWSSASAANSGCAARGDVVVIPGGNEQEASWDLPATGHRMPRN